MGLTLNTPPKCEKFSILAREQHKFGNVEYVCPLGFTRGTTCFDMIKKVEVPQSNELAIWGVSNSYKHM